MKSDPLNIVARHLALGDPAALGRLFGVDIPAGAGHVPGTPGPFGDGIRDTAVRLLVHRGVGRAEATSIAEVLLARDADSAAVRAAFDGLDVLGALAAEG
ncbi:hypothetical protein [Actinoplanes philippinensis]|uniref:hypothetical protein n=1 Tax=Actinoplanes philippinensis TaxID=35752 RepID=UPI0033C94AFD